MNISRKHHYIPKFLIKNFVDDEGMIFVYHKSTDTIKKQSPKGIFYEIDRNTFEVAGEPSDRFEQLYGEFDNMMAKQITNVLRNGAFEPEELMTIVTLAQTLKWRVPGNDRAFEELKEKVSLKDLSVKIVAKDTDDNAIDENVILEIEKSELIQESKRLTFAIAPFLNDHSRLLELYNNSTILHLNNPLGALIGDMPMLEKSNTDYNSLDSFILPLSSSDTFIYRKEGKCTNVDKTFFFNRDLATLHKAEKHVACKNLEQLQKVVDSYKLIKMGKVEDSIIKGLFEGLN
jgi:hypothetical protein